MAITDLACSYSYAVISSMSDILSIVTDPLNIECINVVA